MTYIFQLAILWGKGKILFCDGVRYCEPSGEVISWSIFILSNGILLLLPLLIVFVVLRNQTAYWKTQIANGHSNVDDVVDKH